MAAHSSSPWRTGDSCLVSKAVSHQFQRREDESWAQTFASAATVCRVCKRPFLGGLLGNALECRGCGFLACHSCAANQADWDTQMYGCTSGGTKTYMDFEDLDDRDEEASLSSGAQRELRAAMKRHDLLLDCIQELRTSTRKYHAALRSAFADYKAELRAGIGASEGAEADADTPSRLKTLLRERLAGMSAVMVEQAAAAVELTRQVQMHDAHCGAGSRPQSGSFGVSPHSGLRPLAANLEDLLAPPSSGAAVAPPGGAAWVMGAGPGGAGAGAGADTWRREEVPAVPMFDGELYGVDVTKLLHKIYLYRDDDEIEEGLCCRLFTVIEGAVPQVEFLLPTLTAMVLHTESGMRFLTRELVRLCMMSTHFALLLQAPTLPCTTRPDPEPKPEPEPPASLRRPSRVRHPRYGTLRAAIARLTLARPPPPPFGTIWTRRVPPSRTNRTRLVPPGPRGSGAWRRRRCVGSTRRSACRCARRRPQKSILPLSLSPASDRVSVRRVALGGIFWQGDSPRMGCMGARPLPPYNYF